MSAGTVSLERRGHVLLMGLDRTAKRNAFDLAMWDALCDAYATLEQDGELRVGVVHARGDHFTGGLDLPQWGAAFSSGKWHVKDGGLDPLGLTGPRVTKPVIAAVQGTCLTIGIELMLATDLRIAAASTKFGQIEVKRGIDLGGRSESGRLHLGPSVARPCGFRARSAGPTRCAGCSPAIRSTPPRRCASAWSRRSSPTARS